MSLSYKIYAKKTLNVFYCLPKVAGATNKKFVFAHIIAPHPPYLFDKNGNYNPHPFIKEEPNGYIEQLKFINLKTIITLKKIMQNDKGSKIIVIQGDHGSRTLPVTSYLNNNQKWVQEHYGILNAIYISKSDMSKKHIYNNWKYSSVNTFRLIFNEYFKYNLSILVDDKYYVELKEPFKFQKIK